MSPASALSALLVAALVLAGCGGADEPAEAPKEVAAPLQGPDACDLVSAATVADVVGPSLPIDYGGVGSPDRTSSECGWTFHVITFGDENVRRPFERRLTLEATGTKGDSCAEVKAQGTAVSDLGTKAAIDWTDEGVELTFCRSGGFATITWSALDWQAGKKISPSKAEDTDTLKRLGREVDKRWKSARRATATSFRLPSRGPGPEIPAVCEFVSADTLEAIRVDKRVRSDKSLATCGWELSREGGTTPGSPIGRLLEVDVDSYPDGQYSGWEEASNSARQFSHAYGAAPDSVLGGGSVVAEATSGRGRGAKGAFAVEVSLVARDFGGTEARPDPSNDEIIALTRKVLTEVLAALPQ
ncbi:hypothetical protein [Tenggerimyces flavus]|uniref:DUF3558 domain-containing protein n=1 Tax=Tenggerimyces flavus TaxID=1708749 RepID=A0ABV7YGE6_9ACTN|nr:hypothetical protein [Tenggerimyces flavus]MBM7788004.1 hypothetical protein [Tenggerimyces flavus]